jgi:cytochrome P450
MWPRIIEWTNTVINANDPTVAKDQGAQAVTMQATMEMFKVYAGMFADRRQHPREDLMTALVNARINGKPLTELELGSWAIILTTAGHETTQSTFGMGVHALMQHPDQFEKLKSNPRLLPGAINELLRYLSPAIHFIRTPDRDVEVEGKKIRAGEHMAMFYPSANRDADVFDEPDRLNIERSPNRHLAFGTGPHQCLGMNLARLELKVMFEQFLERVEKIEAVSPPENVYTCATGGYKHFPVRMTVRPKSQP